MLLDLAGSGTKSTQKFTAAGDWDLAWTYDCSKFSDGTGNFAVFAYGDNNQMAVSINGVNQLGANGSSTEHYHAGGTFYFQILSECTWTVKVTG